MHLFTRLRNSRRYPPGLEWQILKKLPAIFLLGTALLLAAYVLSSSYVFEADSKRALIAQYSLLGALLFHWLSVIFAGILCLIVWIMKGPAYVRDPYYLPEQRDYQ